MNNYTIISGFSGIGKSYAAKDKLIRDTIVDLDSSNYNEKDNWVDYYIYDIKKYIEEFDNLIILVSAHLEVRKALKENKLNYIIVAPEFSLESKNEYMRRYFYRKNSVEFIYNMYNHWNDYMNSILRDDAPKIFLNEDEYLSSILRER